MTRRLMEIAAAVRQTFEPVIMLHLYPRSEISINLQVICADGGEWLLPSIAPELY
jgi:exosome complex component RRP41